MSLTGASDMSDVVHDGQLDAAVTEYGGERSLWLDLSTGVSPFSYPVSDIPSPVFSQLPDAGLFADCEAAARQAYNVPEGVAIGVTAGSQMAIQILPYLFAAQPVAVTEFTYQEHALCWQKAGQEV